MAELEEEDSKRDYMRRMKEQDLPTMENCLKWIKNAGPGSQATADSWNKR